MSYQHPNQGGNNPLEFLRNDPQFHTIKSSYSTQSQFTSPSIEQIGQANPELFALLDQHKEAFIELLNEGANSDTDGEEAVDEPFSRNGDKIAREQPNTTIHVSEQEQESLQRLEQLGIPRARVIEAYFACDKNEELAANFLFENPEWRMSFGIVIGIGCG